MTTELARTSDANAQLLPITAVCIVSDKNKCPKGFSPIIKTSDDGTDADLWKENSFAIWSRLVRYLAISREIPDTIIKGVPVAVVTDITIVKETDPIPHGFVAIDYTADSREKALRKKFICIKTEPRDTVIDAVGEVAILNKTKKTPKGFTAAGEVDGALVVFKAVVIPETFGAKHTTSQQNLTTLDTPARSLYPGLAPDSAPAGLDATIKSVNAFTIKSPSMTKQKGVDGVPLKLHSSFLADSRNQDSTLPILQFDISRLDTDDFNYNFALERATLSSS